MDRTKFEVADVFRRYGEAYRQEYGASLCTAQRRAMTAIEVCRTAVLGGHLEQCDHCGHQRNAYNSCANRHCPKCQSLAKARWLDARLADLLPAPYFHVVFTLPEQLASLALQNKRVVYNILFATAAQTLRTIAADPKHLGAQVGFLAFLALVVTFVLLTTLATPSRRSSEAYGSTPITESGIVSQYDVVCICCSGRSSSPDPTFSFV